MDESGLTAAAPDAPTSTAVPSQVPDIRSLIDQSRKMGATDDQIRSLMVKAPFLADTWEASEKAGISQDAVFQHFGLAEPAEDSSPAPDQSGLVDDYGRAVNPSTAHGGAIGNIAGAAAQGAKAGFGDPSSAPNPILSPLAQEGLDSIQREGGIKGKLAQIGSTIAGDIGTGINYAKAAGGALVGAYQGGVSQAGAEVGAPQLGRDLAALPEAFPTGDINGGTAAPGGGLRAAAAETEKRLAAAKISAIGSATDIDGAITAAADAAASPVSATAAAAIPEETGSAPLPQSVGAAASRDMTHPAAANISTADMQANRRVAEMNEILAPPEAGDTTIHVPGSFPTLAESSGDPAISQYENLLRQRNPGEFIGEGKRLTENNKARIDAYDANTIPDTTLNTMRDARASRFEAASTDILPNASLVDLTPTMDWVDGQLSNPRIRENDAVRSVLENFRDRLIDEDGSLKTDPSAAWGIHDNLQNQLAKAKDPLNMTGAEKFAQSHILQAKALVDQALNVATDNRFQAALDGYAQDSKAINAGVLLNDFRSKLTNMNGELQAANFHRFVTNLAKERGNPGIDPAMDISDEAMRSLINIDKDLKRAGLIKLGAAAGSPTNLLGALAESAGLDAAHSALRAIPVAGPLLSTGQKYLAQRKILSDTARHLAPPDGGYRFPSSTP